MLLFPQIVLTLSENGKKHVVSPQVPDCLLEKYLSSSHADRPKALTELIARVKRLIAQGDFTAANLLVQRAVTPALDYTGAQSLSRLVEKLRGQLSCGSKTKLAVLGGFTTTQLTKMIELHLVAGGIQADIYEADYGVFRQEILDPSSETYRFRPQIVFIATSWRDLGGWPPVTSDYESLQQSVQNEVDEWLHLWTTLNQRLGCQIVQNNFETPPWRQFANHETRQFGSMHRYIAAVNQAFQDRSPTFVTIHDVDYLSAAAGRWTWGDERFFHHAKIPCAPECLVEYGHSVGSIVQALLGLTKKCLALDLDNTLWGGVVGDDGLGGIKLGQGDPEGESYLAFQRYLKGLQQRGVLLAVCSKNEASVAKEVFEKHREMVLRLEDISCFVANWDDKATNLRRIAGELNIGMNSMVFIDDNPMERALVRNLAPEVCVPEMPEDPAGYIRALDSHRYCQIVSVSKEDYERTLYYQANAQRAAAEESAGNIDDFLASLNMTALISPIRDDTLERSTQLINKSNQFNLTTRRRSAAEVLALTKDSQWVTRTVSLKDRLGDNGLISVVLAKCDRGELIIDTWLMSCRVLKRGVECALLNHLIEFAKTRKLNKVVGQFIPTAKNMIVKDHYQDLGFALTQTEVDGETWWRLPVDDRWQPLPAHMNIENDTDHD